MATRYGLMVFQGDGALQSWSGTLGDGLQEVQALLPTANGVWIGTRNGLLFRRTPAASTPAS